MNAKRDLKSMSAFHNATITETQLRFNGDVTLVHWQNVTKETSARRNAIQWWMGDLINYGFNKWGEDMIFQFINGLEISEITLRNYRWVAATFLPERRRANLSFSHHEAVASFSTSQQETLLNRCEAEQWSRDTFRSHVREVKQTAALIQKEAEEKKKLARAEIEDAEEVKEGEPLAGEPQVIEGHAVEVQTEPSPEGNVSPVESKDLLEVLFTTWAACDITERRTFLLWAAKNAGPIINAEEQAKILHLVDQIDNEITAIPVQGNLDGGPLPSLDRIGDKEAGRCNDRLGANDGASTSLQANAGDTPAPEVVTDRRDGQFTSPPSAPALTDDDVEIPKFLDRRSKERADV